MPKARAHLIDFDNMSAVGNCHSSQAMCLYYGVFDPSEECSAFDRHSQIIHDCDDHIDLGVLGGRVIFHTLSSFGESDLAFKMITCDDYISYGNRVKPLALKMEHALRLSLAAHIKSFAHSRLSRLYILFLKLLRTRFICLSKSPLLISSAITSCSKVGTVQE